MPNLQKRRLLIQRRRRMMKAAGLKVTKKGKKVPKQIVPVTLERDYFKQIMRAINPAFMLIREELIPRLQEIRDLFLNNTQLDGMRLDSTYSELITKIMKSIKAGSAILVTDLVIRDIADKNANAISTFNKYQVSKQMTSVLGVNPIVSEPYLEPLVKSFTERNVALIKTIPDQYLNQVETTLRTGVEAGKNTATLTKEIQERFNITKNRAKVIARDQVSKFNSSLTKVRQQEAGVSEYIWRTSGDERVRPSHRTKDGKKFKWSKPPSDTGHPGQDYQCLLGTSVLNGFQFIKKLYRRIYTGKLSYFVTDDGLLFGATPNHPILTIDGVKPINSINSGDYIIERFNNTIAAVNSNSNRFKINFCQIFNSFNKSFFDKSASKCSDFHGDGSDQEIDIITPDSFLIKVIDFIFNEKISKLGLSDTDMAIGYYCLSGISNLTFCFKSLFRTKAGFMSRLDLIKSLFNRHFTPFELFAFALAPYFNTRFKKMLSYYSPGNFVMFRNCIFAYTILVHGHDFVNWQFDRASFNDIKSAIDRSINSESLEVLRNNIRIETDNFRNFENCESSGIQISKIVNVFSSDFSGHVYNLQTNNGYYIADNVLVGNCRCTAEPVMDDFFEE